MQSIFFMCVFNANRIDSFMITEIIIMLAENEYIFAVVYVLIHS